MRELIHVLKIINEYDEYDDYDFGYYDSDEELYSYEQDYYTYYKNGDEMEVPLWEGEPTDTMDIPLDDDTDPDMYAEKLKKDIDAAVKAGDYPGLWVHHITVTVLSNYHQTDVDRWSGRSYIDETESDYESEQLELPEDWDDSDPDYIYLSDYVCEL